MRLEGPHRRDGDAEAILSDDALGNFFTFTNRNASLNPRRPTFCDSPSIEKYRKSSIDPKHRRNTEDEFSIKIKSGLIDMTTSPSKRDKYMWRFLLPAFAKVRAFTKQRVSQSDEEFLASCNIGDCPLAKKAALGVRQAVGVTGKIDPCYIRASDDWPGSLEALPTWDSLSLFTLGLELERVFGARLPEGLVLDSFENDGRIVVGVLAVDVYRYLKKIN